MKKNYLIIFTLLLFIPFSVLAATPKVLTVTAENSGSDINYSGTTEDGISAVMCKLYDANDVDLDSLSSSVSDNAFSGSFTDLEDGTYSVGCARYEGGEITKATVVVGDGSSTVSDDTNVASDNSKKTTANNPKTYDEGIRNSLILFVICAAGVIGSIIYLKRRKTLKSN